MKKIVLTLFFLILQAVVFACPVCERQQPKALKGITHGAGPQQNFDYVLVGIMVIIVLLTLSYSVKWLIKPGEKDKDHIKYSILKIE
jgi:hypothetical protein